MLLSSLKRWRTLALCAWAQLCSPVNAATAKAERDLSATCHRFESCATLFESHQDDYELARRLYELGAALPLPKIRSKMKALRRRLPQAHYLLVIEGHLHWGKDPKAARQWYQKARGRFQREGNLRGEAVALLNLAILEAEFGNFSRAGQLHNELEELSQGTQDRYTKVFALTGVAHYRLERAVRLGETYRALRTIEDCDSLPENLRILFLKARAGVAVIFEDFGPAESDLLQATRLAKARKDLYHIAACSNSLGVLYLDWIESGASPETVDRIAPQIGPLLSQSIEAAEKLGRVALSAFAKWALAINYVRLGEPKERSLQLLERCMQETRSGSYLGIYAQCTIAKSEIIGDEQPRAALRLAQKGFEILGRSNLHGERLESWTDLVELSWRLMDAKLAYIVSGAALGTVEALRKDQREELARMRIFSPRAALYQEVARRVLSADEALPDALDKALDILDRSRARTLVEAANAKQAKELDANNPRAIEAYDKLQGSMNELLLLALRRYSEDPVERRRHRLEEQEKWQAQLALLGESVESFQTALGLSRTHEALQLEKVQALLEENEALLTYALGGSRDAADRSETGFAIVITRRESKVIALSAVNHGQLANLVTAYRGRILSPDGGDAHLETQLRSLLVDPVLQRLNKSIKNIVVVPDGALSRLPFSALDASHSYSFAPSLRYWVQLKEKGRPQRSKAKGLALVDPHVSTPPNRSETSSPDRATRSWRNFKADERLPLPQSRREAAVISREIGTSVRVLSGPRASRDNFLASWAPSSTLLHLATHARVDEKEPENSGLVLSSPANQPQHDPYLRVGEIETLNLSHALVVLSGCSTASGKTVSGEGVLSIARAFQRGGAVAVVASLWPVYDKETADFFERFYEHLADGASVGESVYQSQQALRQEGAAPSSYTAFVVLGDATMRFEKQSQYRFLWLLSLCPLVVLFALRRRKGRS